MSNKLTNKTLDLLIEQVLNEKAKFPFNTDTEFKDVFGNNYDAAKDELGDEEKLKVKIKALGSQDEPKDVLDRDDFDELPDSGDAFDAAKAIQKHGRSNFVKAVASKGFDEKPTAQNQKGLAGKNLPSTALLTQYQMEKNSNITARAHAAINALETDSLVNATKLINFLRVKYRKFNAAKKGRWGEVLAKYDYLIGQKKGTADYEKALTNLKGSLTALGADETPLTRPNVQSQAAASGKFAGEIISSFNKVFTLGATASTLPARVERISEISKAMMSDEVDKIKEISFLKGLTGNELKRATLSCVMVLDYVAAITKYFDHGSGGYLFEAFCALITGGKVVGKGMGAGDFKMKTDNGRMVFGSSKYYQAGSTMTQALSGFPSDENVTYIVAQKQDTSDPDDLVNIGIHIAEVKVKAGKIATYKGNLEFSIEKGELKIKASGSPTAVVKMAKNEGTSFRASLQSTMDKQKGGIKEAFNMFKEFLAFTAQTDQLTKNYIDDGKKVTGNSALKALEEADKKQVELINAIRGDAESEVSADSRTLKENKTKSLKDLDKLIERVILKEMLKK